MRMNKLAVLVSAVIILAVMSVFATFSEPVLVDATHCSRHWVTVFTNTVFLTWNWPAEANHAQLNIVGMNRTFSTNFTTDVSNCVWQAFGTDVPDVEDVYDLTLTFTDEGAEVVEVQSAQLAVMTGAFGETPVNAVAASAAWSRVRDNVVIPYDTAWNPASETNFVSTALEIAKQEGMSENNVFQERAGYYGWKLRNSAWGYGVFNLALTFPGTDAEFLAELSRLADGTVIVIQ